MLKDATYKEKFDLLQGWMTALIEDVKKDLRNDHLKGDWQFCKTYLAGKNLNKITNEELVEAYSKAVKESENGEALAEFIAHRWLMRNGDLYHYFEQELSKINPNFGEIEKIDSAKAKTIIDGAVKEFGAVKTYLFTVVNSVAFSKEDTAALEKSAKNEVQHKKEEAVAHSEKLTLDQLKTSYEQQIARLTDKYEKKLLGMQKKYTTDVDTLKKQVANLQRKLSA